MRRQDLPYTLLLGLSGASGGAFPDVFASSYPRESRQIARRLCRPLANDPRLIGYFIDENLSWDPDALFLQYMSFGNFSPGRKALLHFLQARYPTLEELNQAWRTSYSSFEEIGRVPQARAVIPEEIKHGFLQLVAERYFKLAQEAIRSVDANHLILGCRLPSRAPTLVFEAMRERVDVVSISNCDAPSSSAALLEIYRITQRPLLITGLGGLPTTEAQGLLLEAPAARGAPYTRSVEELLALPMVVGGHWRRHTDRPAGDSPGEEGATGLVDIQDEPHADFVTTVTRTNQQAYELHAGLNNPTDVE